MKHKDARKQLVTSGPQSGRPGQQTQDSGTTNTSRNNLQDISKKNPAHESRTPQNRGPEKSAQDLHEKAS